MPTYDFRTLSAHDFEMLVRDLMQKELGVYIESFKRGRDGGIDLRHVLDARHRTIAQCKHFVESGYSTLLSHLRNKEVKKVQKLRPRRYIIATSVGLTPGNKDEVAALFSPYCSGPQDVFGADDLNNLLGRHPEIEEQHFKLWLTSTTTLRALLHSGVINETQAERERIARRLPLYVHHRSYGRATDLLERSHYCIIAGQPGIGKTTLAEILMVAYMARGFDVVVVSRDIRDAFAMYDSSRKQLFVYDDFLGTTALEARLHKNEDGSLLRFLEVVAASKSARLILTTREYILNQAKEVHEKLAAVDVDVARCTITVDSYTAVERAAILHNHVWFSALPHEYKAALLVGRAYRRILRHPNYVPRIVQWMTDPALLSKVPPSEYVSRFLHNLDHPHDLWKHPFENQLSERARHLLLVMLTLSMASVETVETAFDAYRASVCAEYGAARSSDDFARAARELEDAFLSIQEGGQPGGGTGLVARFHHPSIADFLEERVRSSPRDGVRLIDAAVAFEQLARVWALLKSDSRIADAVWRNAARLLDTPGATLKENRLWREVSSDEESVALFQDRRGLYAQMHSSTESRLQMLCEMAVETPHQAAPGILRASGAVYCRALRENTATPVSVDAARLLRWLELHPVDVGVTISELCEALNARLLEGLVDVDDLDCLAVVSELHPAVHAGARALLYDVLADWIECRVTDAGFTERAELDQAAGVVSDIGDRVGLDVSQLVHTLEARSEELKEQELEQSDDAYESWRDSMMESEHEEQLIDGMFAEFVDGEDVVSVDNDDDDDSDGDEST